MTGTTVSHYEILDKLGEGGMGQVFRGTDLRLNRAVALKFLPRELTANAGTKARFIREAQTAGSLDHPNVCTIYEVDETPDGTTFIVMAYCEGPSLKDKLENGHPTVEESVRWGIQIASGLQHAHEKGIVHRDIKPANVMITAEGNAKIVDFGLAKLRGGTKLTRALTALGTIEYMSPEQTRGDEVDRRTDLWSLGCLLYELLSGQAPFRGEHEQAILYGILNTTPTPLTAMRGDIPGDLERVVGKCLEKDPAARYQTADELIADLRRHQGPSGETPPSGTSLGRRAVRKTPWIPIAAAAFLIVAAVLALLFLPSSPETSTEKKVIAVLPFLNLTGDPGEEYFSLGISDDILTQLYKIGDLKVISRTTMQQYKDSKKSVRAIGAELHAGAVLEGSVRRVGNRVRIVAQLIDAQTDDHLWAETYDRGIEDVLAVQTEIAQRIATVLHATLTSAEQNRLSPPASYNPEAYTLILQGAHLFARGSRQEIARSIEKFKGALAVEPGNARAWAHLATAYARQADIGVLGTVEGYALARRAAERSLELDDQLAQAHTIMGWIKRSYDWDWLGAEAACRKALELAPGDITAIRNMANMDKSLGRFDEAIRLIRRAAELDPTRVPIYTSLGLFSMYAGRFEDAAAAYRKAIELNPQYPAAHTFLGLVRLLDGDPDEAIREILTESDEGWRAYGLAQAYHAAGRSGEADSALHTLILEYGSESAYQVAEVYAYRGESDSAFAWLDRAYLARDGGLSEIQGDPFMQTIVSDPRYTTFLNTMRFPNRR